MIGTGIGLLFVIFVVFLFMIVIIVANVHVEWYRCDDGVVPQTRTVSVVVTGLVTTPTTVGCALFLAGMGSLRGGDGCLAPKACVVILVTTGLVALLGRREGCALHFLHCLSLRFVLF